MAPACVLTAGVVMNVLKCLAEASPSPPLEEKRSLLGCGRSVHGEPQRPKNAHWNHEPRQTENPKGIPPQSPGLPSLRGYPGFETSEILNPNGVAPSGHRPVHGEADLVSGHNSPASSGGGYFRYQLFGLENANLGVESQAPGLRQFNIGLLCGSALVSRGQSETISGS
jgi:hypothetical protein